LTVDPSYIAARRMLLDALADTTTGDPVPWRSQRDAVIVAGAQAVYLRTGDPRTGVAPYITDGDLAFGTAKLADEPRLETAAGHRFQPELSRADRSSLASGSRPSTSTAPPWTSPSTSSSQSPSLPQAAGERRASGPTATSRPTSSCSTSPTSRPAAPAISSTGCSASPSSTMASRSNLPPSTCTNSSATTADRATTHIADDGPGIPPDQQEAIFERFTTLDVRSDTGLGLAIARELAHNQHGNLTFSGAFILSLPTATDTTQ
jgi:hypothetical protein